MKIWHRIKNLVALSDIELSKEKKEQITNIINKEPHKMATIIKRSTPVEDFLKKQNE